MTDLQAENMRLKEIIRDERDPDHVGSLAFQLRAALSSEWQQRAVDAQGDCLRYQTRCEQLEQTLLDGRNEDAIERAARALARFDSGTEAYWQWWVPRAKAALAAASVPVVKEAG
jgi:hypothetical protein